MIELIKEIAKKESRSTSKVLTTKIKIFNNVQTVPKITIPKLSY